MSLDAGKLWNSGYLTDAGHKTNLKKKTIKCAYLHKILLYFVLSII